MDGAPVHGSFSHVLKKPHYHTGSDNHRPPPPMAAALRRVSQNYNWTIQRAHNDLHEVIYSQPQTPITYTCGCWICEYSPGVLDVSVQFSTSYVE